jgi:hypothetical protein
VQQSPALILLFSLWEAALSKIGDAVFVNFIVEIGVPSLCIQFLRDQEVLALSRDRNRFVPYYAVNLLHFCIFAHVKESVTLRMIGQGVLDVLAPLAAGALTWLEAQMAANAVAQLVTEEPVGRVAREAAARQWVSLLCHVNLNLVDAALQHTIVYPERSHPSIAPLLAGKQTLLECRCVA